MLPAKYVAFLIFVWLGGSMLGAVMEGAYLGEGEGGVLNQIAFWQTISEEQDWGFWEVIGSVPGFFQGMFDMLTLKFAFIQGTDWELYRWFVIAPFVGLFVYGAIMTLAGIFSRNVS